MNRISFMSANLVARELGYAMPDGWPQGDAAANAFFAPLNTFEERFDDMLSEVVDLGYKAIDLWTAHLNWTWATPAHLVIAKRLLEKHGLRVVSYAGGLGETEAEVEAACHVCRQLDIPILGGGSGLLQTDRKSLVTILRKHGLVFAYENHPEASAEEVMTKLGEGDEDVLGVAVDTGWFATQGADALEELKKLSKQIKHVHLKDVLAKPEEPTGYPFKDMGHQTCELGKGIVPIKDCIEHLVTNGYRGALGIEHEPEDFDPREDCRASLATVTKSFEEAIVAITPPDPVGVAIVGCGNIADRYAAQINSYPHIQLFGCQDIDRTKAETLATEFGGKVYDTLEEIFADDAVEIVVNLTIHHVHEEIIRQCLESGKPVHTKKPIALSSEAAWGLVELADKLGLRLSSAPTTWLGEAQQTVYRKIKEGAIGQPRVAYAEVNWGRIESWHPNPGPFYAVGPVFDVAVYPLTLLTAFFGPAQRVIAGGGILYPDRVTKEGKPFTVESPDWSSAVIEFASGMKARVTASFYVTWTTTQTGLEIHGDDGMVRMDRWDVFESPAYIASGETNNETWKLVPDAYPAENIEFARGLSDLAFAIREDRPHLTTCAHAAHVVEIAEAILTSIRESRPVEIDASRFQPREV
jgi:predicted dehydrogenase/sugar phosphate isomerase/epimerase